MVINKKERLRDDEVQIIKKRFFLFLVGVVFLIGVIGGVMGVGYVSTYGGDDLIANTPEKIKEKDSGQEVKNIPNNNVAESGSTLSQDGETITSTNSNSLTGGTNGQVGQNGVEAETSAGGDIDVQSPQGGTDVDLTAEGTFGGAGGGAGGAESPAGAGGGAGGGGGGGDGGGGGGFLQRLDAAAQAAMQVLGTVASIAGPIKDALETNGKGTTSIGLHGGQIDVSLLNGAELGFKHDGTPLGFCDNQQIEVCENVTKRVCKNQTSDTPSDNSSLNLPPNSSITGGVITGRFVTSIDCENVTTKECKTKTVCVPRKSSGASGVNTEVILSQNDKSQEAKTTIADGGTTLADSQNLQARVIGQANIYTPADQLTQISMQGSSGEPAPYSSSGGIGISGNAIKEEDDNFKNYGITGALIAGDMKSSQYVALRAHDMGIGGKDIWVDNFKSFNEVEAIGSELHMIDGATEIKFNRQKIYYPRQVRFTPYFINKVSNLMDNQNYFRMIKGGDKGSFLIDGKKVATVGDKVVKHPTINGLVIAKEREEMWKHAGEVM